MHAWFCLTLALDFSERDLKPIDHSDIKERIAAEQDDYDRMEKLNKKMMQGVPESAVQDATDPSSLLERGAPKWTEQDAKQTESILQRSYKQIDSVQDAIIKAADEELAEQKSLPTLAQATHHWNAAAFGTPAKTGSLLQTGAKAPLDDEYAAAIDFSKLDKLRSKIGQEDARMADDYQQIKLQAAKDAEFAKQQGAPQAKPASLSEGYGDMVKTDQSGRGRHTEMGRLLEGGRMRDEMPHKPMDFDDMAAFEAKEHAEEHKHAKRGEAMREHAEHAASKLSHVQGKLALLERALSSELLAHPSPALEQKMHKLRELLAMSKAASGVVASVEGSGSRTSQQLQALKAIKQHLQHFAPHEQFKHRAEVAEHVRELAAHLGEFKMGHVVPLSLVQDAPQPDDGYAPIESGLDSLEQRIQKQVKDLKEQEKKDTSAQVNTLTNESPNAYKFDLTQPSYLEVDAKGNMRKH